MLRNTNEEGPEGEKYRGDMWEYRHDERTTDQKNAHTPFGNNRETEGECS